MKSLDSAMRWTHEELLKLCREQQGEIAQLRRGIADLMETCTKLRSLLGTGVSTLMAVDAVLQEIEKAKDT